MIGFIRTRLYQPTDFDAWRLPGDDRGMKEVRARAHSLQCSKKIKPCSGGRQVPHGTPTPSPVLGSLRNHSPLSSQKPLTDVHLFFYQTETTLTSRIFASRKFYFRSSLGIQSFWYCKIELAKQVLLVFNPLPFTY